MQVTGQANANFLQVIGKQINNVEAFGNIGAKNLDRIAKIVAKHRALNHDNLELFLDISHTELSLYDCTSELAACSALCTWLTALAPDVPDSDLASIASFCPHLQRLTLKMCGRMDDSVLVQWAAGFKKLEYLSLYGMCSGSWLSLPTDRTTFAAPYLVTAQGWCDYFKSFNGEHSLMGFGMRQSARASPPWLDVAQN